MMCFSKPEPRAPNAEEDEVEETISIGPDELMNLLPVILEFLKKKRAKQTIDPKETLEDAANALGIDDLSEFASHNLETMLSEQLGEENAKKLAPMIISAGIAITKMVSDYAQKKATSVDLLTNLDSLYRGNTETLIGIVKDAYAIELPDGAEELLARYSLDVLAAYCFIAAYKIYKKAAEDTQIAHEKRLAIEKRCAESIAGYERYHLEMETLVDKYLGTHLNIFESGIEAMDDAILADDADGYIAGNAKLQESLGRHQQFRTQEEFDDLMGSDDVFKL